MQNGAILQAVGGTPLYALQEIGHRASAAMAARHTHIAV
jgi:hypothetical protein